MKKKINSACFKITPPGGAVKRKKFIKELAKMNSSCLKITPPGGAVVRPHRLLQFEKATLWIPSIMPCVDINQENKLCD